MKPLISFLKSSWKFLMFLAFCLMAGYALYYSSFTNSDIWQFELTLTHPTIHTISYKSTYTTMAVVQVTKEATKEATQAVGVDTFNTTKSPDPKYLVPLNEQRSQCNVSGMKSWEHGVVTQFFPLIKRNCSRLVAGSQSEVYQVRQQLQVWRNEESDIQFVQRMNSCVNVIEEFSNNFYVSSEEKDFPLGFIFVVYTNVRQVVRLLKAIYRPHNVYCIHPDARREEFAHVFQQISKCLDNVFVASKLERVYYGHHSIMDAQLNCMKDLTEYDQCRWRYVINLVGRELPLQTNRHIVKLLKQASDVSIVESQPIGKSFFSERFRYKIGVNDHTGRLYRKQEKLGAIPHGIKIYKGSTHFALTRQFAHFILTNQKAIDFRQYLNDVWIPEESFYASLYRLFWLTKPEIQGDHSNSVTPPISYIEVSIWLAKLSPSDVLEHCSGFKRHAVCIVAIGDLHRVYEIGVNKNSLFFNKYFMEVDHVIMDCMEERLVKQNMLEYARDVECLLPPEVTDH